MCLEDIFWVLLQGHHNNFQWGKGNIEQMLFGLRSFQKGKANKSQHYIDQKMFLSDRESEQSILKDNNILYHSEQNQELSKLVRYLIMKKLVAIVFFQSQVSILCIAQCERLTFTVHVYSHCDYHYQIQVDMADRKLDHQYCKIPKDNISLRCFPGDNNIDFDKVREAVIK